MFSNINIPESDELAIDEFYADRLHTTKYPFTCSLCSKSSRISYDDLLQYRHPFHVLLCAECRKRLAQYVRHDPEYYDHNVFLQGVGIVPLGKPIDLPLPESSNFPKLF